MNNLLLFFLIPLNFLNAVTFVSLGDTCLPALALRAAGLRHFAYPFDWIISPHRSIVLNLSTEFKHFLDAQFLYIDSRCKSAVVNNLTGNRFAHDFPIQGIKGNLILNGMSDDQGTTGIIHPQYLSHLDAITNKYKRRVDRFYELLYSGEPIFFIRHVTTMFESKALGIIDKEKFIECDMIAQAKEIRDVLESIMQHDRWCLVMLGEYEIFKEVSSEKHIKTYFVPTENFTPPIWNTASTAWQIILQQLYEEGDV